MRETLKLALRIQFKTSDVEPTDSQLQSIISDIERIQATRIPTVQDWGQIVAKHCPSTGKWLYKGLDFSDLNALLAKIKSR